MQTKIDTLTETNKQLTTKSDSLSKDLGKYFELYTVIKDKVVKSDFDPARMATIIDSFIDFKGTRADFRMYFMNTLVGPRVSFEIPGVAGVYYFGQMTQ